MDLGVTVIERETFRAALEIARQTLRGMGLSDAEVRRTIAAFSEMDTRRLVEDYQIASDPEKMRVNAMRQADELEQLFSQDEAALEAKEAAE
jgi:hypothetical protein